MATMHRQSLEIYYCEFHLITGPWKECHIVATHNVIRTLCYTPLQLHLGWTRGYTLSKWQQQSVVAID